MKRQKGKQRGKTGENSEMRGDGTGKKEMSSKGRGERGGRPGGELEGRASGRRERLDGETREKNGKKEKMRRK